MYNRSTNKKDVRLYDINLEKLIAAIDVRGVNDCWNWKRGKNTSGYGMFHVRTLPEDYERSGRMMTQIPAHRVMFNIFNGDLNPDAYVCHKCDNPACCNPTHLWRGSAQDNVHDMIAKGRGYWQKF